MKAPLLALVLFAIVVYVRAMGCSNRNDCNFPDQQVCMKVTLHNDKEYTRCLPNDFVEIVSKYQMRFS